MATNQIQKRELFLVSYLSFQEILNAINQLDFKEYAFILHDKDDDIIKGIDKPHYHVYLYLNKKVDIEKVAKLFNIASNLIEFPFSKIGCLRYLIHRDVNDKYQYNVGEIVTNIVNIKEIICNINYDSNKTIIETYINLLKDKSYKTFSDSIIELMSLGYSEFIVKHTYLLKVLYDDIYSFRNK